MNYNNNRVHKKWQDAFKDLGNKYSQWQNYKKKIKDSKVDSNTDWYLFGTIPSYDTSWSPEKKP